MHINFRNYVPDMYLPIEEICDRGFAVISFCYQDVTIDDKEAIEVNIWEYYLIYAQILGIADKVAKQFKKLYPEITEENMEDILKEEIGCVFVHVLEDAGVFKCTGEGREAFGRFISVL